MSGSQLAALSNHLFAVAVVLYSLAMLCFAGDYAFGRLRRPAAVATATAVPAQSRTPALVGAPPAPPAGAPPAPAPPDRAPATADAGGAGAQRRGRDLGRLPVGLTAAGWAVHVAEVVTRGFAVQRVPWGNMYEFSSVVALVAVTGFLLVQWRYQARWLGVFVLLPVVLYLGLAGTVLYVKAGPLVPALNSYWIAIHVVAAMLATGTFMVAGVVACLQLARMRHDRRVVAGGGAAAVGIAGRLPSAARLDALEYRIVCFAFPVWTFAVIAGAIWAESAWGRYWGWDPKETWSFITWVVYAAYLHSRSTTSWRRAAPYIALTGFLALLFNYYVINVFISGLHSYAGI